ncbi:MAG: hypothetical protein HN754_07935 [Opitutae bacterium]|nr:hypothetical protein [Opitutae bacterium]
MKVIALFSLTLFFTTLGIAQELHPWTDLQGRTLEASFMKSDGVTVTINWNGKVVPIPLASLSPESQALAQKLSAPSVSVNPFDTIKAPANPKQLHPWTDLQGRTLKAVFIKSDSSTVTVEWQGKVVPLPLASLNPESRALAIRLGGGFQTKVAPVETKKEVVIKKPASSGKLSLDAEHNWKSSTGSLIKAKFISIEGDSINLALYGGRSEQSIPLVRLSEDSRQLAKKLQAMLVQQNKLQQQLAGKRKSMKVPPLVEADLGKSHSWKSSDGNLIEAIFVAANEKGVTLLMKNNPNRPYELPWVRLSAESQALGEGLKRLKEKLMPKNPAILPANGGTLSRYGDGKWKGYNTVLESAVYDVALHSSGNVVKVWLKNQGKEGDSALGERAKRVPLSVNFRAYYYLNPGERNKQWRHRKIVSYENPPKVSMDREETTIRGTLDNGSTFEYVMQINHRGLSFWGEVDEKKSGENATIFSIALYSPNFIPDVANKTMKEIEPLVGDGCLYIDPLESKRAKIPLLDKWTDVLGKFSGNAWNPIKSAELMGFPFGSHKIKVTPTSLSGMDFRWGKGYSGTFPFQGIHLVHRTEDSYEAASSKTPSDYKKRLEVPKSKRLNVNIIRGRG